MYKFFLLVLRLYFVMFVMCRKKENGINLTVLIITHYIVVYKYFKSFNVY